MAEKNKYSKLTGSVIGSAMEVHSELGNGFPEVIYQRSLEIEILVITVKFPCLSISKENLSGNEGLIF